MGIYITLSLTRTRTRTHTHNRIAESIELDQGSQTRGPPDAFVRPANILKTDKSKNFAFFREFGLLFRASFGNYDPQTLFSNNLRPADHFFLR